ncbi:MAG: hypothetical protein CMH70_05330 [Nitrosomonadaceae bacterium]|nr:hypothetical protein [Nitrosomonadaceae bacterium]|tara:strand:+ start:2338 stop:3636 length:1299 start_codon:yes stop_codon:yes gene_type:complete
MIKRLILLFFLFLSFCLMGTTAKAMDCEWVSNFKNNSGLETGVSNKDYLKTPIPREEYKRLLESFSSYSDCVDKEIKMILTKMSSLETAGTNRAQLILTLEEKLKEIKNTGENVNQKLLLQEQQGNQLREEITSLEKTFNKLIESLELALADQMRDLKEVDDQLESKLKSNANKINKLSARLTNTDNKMGKKLNNLNKKLETQMIDLKGIDNELESKLESAANKIEELSARLTEADNKMDNNLIDLNKTLSDKTLYGIISILTVTLLIILLFMFLRKSVFEQKTDLNSNLESMKKDAINLDNKLISLIESQLSVEGSKESNSGEIDHSLALKVADEIVRIQKNTSRMDSNTKGLKQLVASVKRIQDNFSSNGYDIVEMLGQPYDEGMKASANFIPDEDLNENEQIITKIIKPQVNYQGVMIQAAQIEVSQGG